MTSKRLREERFKRFQAAYRLEAAAPDLLEAVKRLLSVHLGPDQHGHGRDSCELCEFANAAVAKATRKEA